MGSIKTVCCNKARYKGSILTVTDNKTLYMGWIRTVCYNKTLCMWGSTTDVTIRHIIWCQ